MARNSEQSSGPSPDIPEPLETARVPFNSSELLLSLIDVRLAWLDRRAHRVLEALLESGGVLGSANALASEAGLRNRHRLGRLLRAEGLPGPRRLPEWLR